MAALIRTLPTLPPGGEECVDGATAIAERLILGLRLDTGVPLAAAGEPPLSVAWDWARGADLVEVTPDARVRLTTRGRLLSNELFSRMV